MNRQKKRFRSLIARTLVTGAVIAGLVLAASPRASADEGYDLMRQITTQWVKPLIMIVLDRSGSMFWTADENGSRWYFKYNSSISGYLYSASDWTYYHKGHGQGFWVRVKRWAGAGPYTGKVNSGTRRQLRVPNSYFSNGTVIRVSGSSYPADNGLFKIGWVKGSGSTRRYKVYKQKADGTFETSYHFFAVQTGLTVERPTTTLWYFVPPSRMAIAKNVWGNSVRLWHPSIKETGWDQRNKPYYLFEGEGPINGAWKEWTGSNGWNPVWHNWSRTVGHEPQGDPQYTDPTPPADMAGRFSKVADMGLIAYSGSCRTFSPIVDIDPDDDAQGPVLASLHHYFDVVANGGLTPSGSTPTRGALQGALDGLSTAYTSDAKKICGRTYGAILMTDGQSNYCNPSNGSWWSCPSNWTLYPAGKSDAIWKMAVGGKRLYARTWVIGISQGVGPCELNYTAYKGRTDASSPNQDAGADIDADPYLTAGNDDVFDYAVLNDPVHSHGPYAYFAGSVDELRRALLEILASLGAGDYTTSAPAVAGSASGTTNVAVMPSTEYPTWKGHLRAFANERDNNGQSQWVEKWDAGEVLSASGNNNGYSRKIYTWDPAQDYQLVEVTRSNVSRLNSICGSACTAAGGTIDSATVDFIRGVGRDWKLGALINSTPAVVGPPNHWRQGVAEHHSAFEDEYADRHRLVWVGSSDGMVHAFDAVDGAEVLALIPPDMLDQQVALYQTWLKNPGKYPMGQYKHPAEHKYGIANSLRFADVWDDSLNDYRTLLIIPEGPGGSGLHAVDITHPYPGRTIGSKDWDADPNFDDSEPVTPLWSMTADGEAGTSLLSGLGETWSLPAIALLPAANAHAEPESLLILGSGFLENESNTLDAKALMIDPIEGTVVQTVELPRIPTTNAGTDNQLPLVGQEAFADAVLWQTDAGYYHEDNLADEGIQVDLNGRMWTIAGSSFRTASKLIEAGANQPLYYSPGVAAYPTIGPTYNLFAFSSGTFYERSERITGSDSNFVPKLYIAIRNLETGGVDSVGVPITDLPLPEGQSGTLGDRAQVVAPPLLLVPAQGSSGNPFALYLVYDPDAGLCVGKSYIVWLEFNPDELPDVLNHPGNWTKSFEAGEGAAGGFALAGDKVVVSQSAVGQGQEAHLIEVPGLTIPPGNPGLNISWWYELR